MRRTVRACALACGLLVAAGCTRAPAPTLGSMHGPCRNRHDWLAQFAVRRAERSDTALVRLQRSGLAVQAREEAGAIDSVLRAAEIRVTRGERARASDFVATGAVGEHGWFLVDAPAPSSAYVEARWFGYVPRGEAVQLRTGYRDTVVIHLRYDVVCLSAVGP